MLTPHCSAASGMVPPPSIASTTRLRKSSEYGFAIPAGLLPAGSLNHIRADMGIPDSAFSGNALSFSHCIVVDDANVLCTRNPSGVATTNNVLVAVVAQQKRPIVVKRLHDRARPSVVDSLFTARRDRTRHRN